jgi:ABC-type transport system involved in Fe-S cluster assembly fused permease/ATPase subunit
MNLCALFSFIGPFIWPVNAPIYRLRLILCLFFVVIAKTVAACVPFFLKKSVEVLQNHPETIPVYFLMIYGISRGISITLIELQEVIFTPLKQRAVRILSTKSFSHFYNLDLDYHLNRKTGTIGLVVGKGTRALEKLLQYSTFSIIPTVLEIFIVLLTVFFLYDYLVSICMAFSISLYIYFTVNLTNWRSKFSNKVNLEDGKCSASTIEGLLNYETIKYFGNELHEVNQHDKTQRGYEIAVNKSKYGIAVVSIIQGVIISLSLSITMLYCAWRISKNNFTLGDFILVNSYMVQLYQPLNILSFTYRELKESLSQLYDLVCFLDISQEIKDIPNASDLKVEKGEIIFDNVSFGYDENNPLLKKINFRASPRARVGIVGSSGSGKTTIARLLNRFYKPQEGKILIDGQDIQEITEKSLRLSIGVVPQDISLFHQTIFYNVHYGNFEASLEAVHTAITRAHLDNLIKNLPDRYDSVVGERGLKLSGGEKQRIAIARVFLKDSPIVIFDEATSSLDTTTEQEIQEQLNIISEGKTTIIITHRLTTVTNCDKILVLDNGCIVEEGTHENLLRLGGRYKSLWVNQTQVETEVYDERGKD